MPTERIQVDEELATELAKEQAAGTVMSDEELAERHREETLGDQRGYSRWDDIEL